MRKLVCVVCVGIGLGVCGPVSAATITVNATTDTEVDDGVCTLREAITASNTDTASGITAGECAAGSGADTIDFNGTFDGTAGTSTIAPVSDLPGINQQVTIAGGNCGSPKPCVGLDTGGRLGFNVSASNVSISGIALSDAAGTNVTTAILDSASTTGLTVRNMWFGIRLDGTGEENQHGILLTGDNAVIGGTSTNDRNVFANHVGTVIRIFGAADNARVQGNYIGTNPDGTTAGAGGLHAITVTGDATFGTPVGTLIGGPEAGDPGTCEAPCNVIANTTSSTVDLNGSGGGETPAGQAKIEGNFVGLGADGTDLGGSGITVGEADDVTVGGDASRRNYVSQEITALAGATNLDVVSNFVGLNPAGTTRIEDSARIRIGQAPDTVAGATIADNRIGTLASAAIDLSTTDSVVQGNVIGIGTGGENVGGVPGATGIVSNTGAGNLIGGTGPGQGNVIGNASNGIVLNDDGTTVVGNTIGTNAAETQSHPIANVGINVSGDDGNVIGGTTAAGENVIVNVTAQDAILLNGDGVDETSILRNRGSAAAGQEFIDLRNPFGPGNGPNGPNNDIQAPVITAGATSAQVSGTGALPGATVRVYRTASAAGAATARDVIAYAGQATADGAGNWTLTCPSAGCEVGLPGAGQVTANQTATNGDSSEMASPKAYIDLPPETTITAGPADGAATGSSPQFQFASSEPGSTFTCSVDGGAFTACTSPKALGPLPEGPHTFAVKAKDGTNNEDATPASRGFTVDTTPPQTQIDSGPAEGSTTDDTTPTFGFSATEAGSSFECRLDGAAFAACSGPGAEHTPAPLAEGQHTFEVRATDPAGNADQSPAARTFTLDVPDSAPPGGGGTETPPGGTDNPPAGGDDDPPETTITKAPKDKLKVRKTATVTYEFRSDEAGSSFRCELDGKAVAPCASPLTLKGLKKGTHSFEVAAVDAAGNVDSTPATDTFKVKRKPKRKPRRAS
jgi:CSLREA domain-containing protein